MDVLKLAKPTLKEEIRTQKIVDKFLNKLNRRLIGAVAIVGGSFAKNTWLSGDHDIDIFVAFSKKHDKDKISNILETTLKKVFLFVNKIEGSRTYYQIKFKGYLFEIIPVLKIDDPEEAENIMDISPMHVHWVNNNVKNKDDVRKLKLFLKANYCYGAESYIKGFSGYVTEILIAYYGSFDRVIESAIDWKEYDIIDTKNRKIVLRTIDKSKLSPLIVIDPVQKERNAAAALSKEKFDLFIKICKEYVKSYSTDFFIKKLKIPENAIVLKVKPLKGRKDIVGSKLLKVYEYIKNKLDEDFVIEESSWNWDKKVLFWYVVKNKELSEFKKHYGPHLDDRFNLEKFKEKWTNNKIFAEAGRVYINIKRKNTKLKPFVQDLINDNELKDKLKSIKIYK